MSDYVQLTDFSAKDALTTGDPEKIILGSDVDEELTRISTAITSKYDVTDLATQAEAEAGTNNVAFMSPLRTQQWWTDQLTAANTFSGANIFSATNTFTTAQTISSTSPTLNFNESGVAADQGKWQIRADASEWNLYTMNDADAAVEAAIRVNRSGANIAGVSINPSGTPSEVNVGGVLASDFARLSQANAFTSANTWTQTANSAVTNYVSNPSSGTSANARWSAYNDAGRHVSIAAASTAYSSNFLSGGPTGESGNLWTSGAIPLTLGTNDTAALNIDSSQNFNFYDGTVTTTNSSSSEVGFKGLPTATDETPVLTDSDKIILATTNVTIPANGTIAFPVGTVIVVYNTTAGNITISVTTDALNFAGTASTGTRTLAQKGIASLTKVASTTWVISGAGLS